MMTEFDYIVVGGGLTGCALASRLKEGSPSARVLLLEAGQDASKNEKTVAIFDGFGLAGGDLDWSYKVEPQKHIGGRQIVNISGKVLGGGSILNYGGWCRGDKADYDDWAKVVGDERWNYEGFLPYFKKTENYHSDEIDEEEQGVGGPMHITGIAASDPRRKYGLRDILKDAFIESGASYNSNPTSSILGICEFRENFYRGKRQPSNLAYGLKGVEVETGALVQKVLFAEGPEPVATGVQLADGRRFTARKEVIIAAGTWRTPQILMLSGIGPSETLKNHNITALVSSPEVGAGMFEHFALFQFYKLRDPSKPFSFGNPHWTDPAYFIGMPVDWVVNDSVPAEILRPAVEKDNQNANSQADIEMNNNLLQPDRPLVEVMTLYSPILPGLPNDGSLIAVSIMQLVPTSRGNVTISSADINDHPVVDPNYFATAADQAVLIHGTRRALRALLASKAGSEHVECEVPPPGMAPLSPDSSDEDIRKRIEAVGQNHMHAMGSAQMGKVVDTNLRVKGVKGLRVVDASVFPVGIGGHPQATLYALAEKAADLILGRA